PFHIRIVSEKIAIGVKRNIKGIPVTCADQLPVFTQGIDMSDPSARHAPAVGMTAGVLDLRKEIVRLPYVRQQVIVHFRKIGVVSGYQIQRDAVGGDNNTVRTMLALTVQFTDQRDLVKLVIPVGVLYP